MNVHAHPDLDVAVPALDASVPVLVLGGKENSLAIARHLGRHGITVRVSGPANCWGMYSRYCRERLSVPFGQSHVAYWAGLLLDPQNTSLDGHVIVPCSDEAIEFIADNHDQLSERYVLEEAPPDQRRAMLDKKKTLELARAAGLDTPNFWSIESDGDIERLRGQVSFPVMVKPVHSHKFSKVFGRKLFIVEEGFEELAAKVALACDAGLDVMVMEMIPGPDTLLSSYYTYLDTHGQSLFHFTKRVLRRYPVNRGGGCYHITDWLPETAAAGERFFAHMGFRGLGNIEFKYDERDGRLKVIEVNARFTATQELAVAAGAPLDLIVYCDLTGQVPPRFETFEEDLRFWYPLRDFLSFLELRRMGELTFWGWVKSVATYEQVSPLFDPRDLSPVFGAAWATVQKLLRGRS